LLVTLELESAMSLRNAVRIGAVLVGVIAAWAPACGQAIEQKSVTIAVSAPPSQLYFLPVVLTRQLGYFAQEGVAVELQHFNAGSKALESLVGGSADIVAGAYEHTMRMQAKGVDLQSFVLFGRYPQNALGIAKSKAASYRSPADLKGQKVGITGPGSATEVFLNLVLHQAGLQPSDVTPVTVGAATVAVAAMKRSDELYAISNLDPAITELTMAGDIVIVADSRTAAGTKAVYGGDYASGSLYAQRAFVQKNPHIVQAIANAMVRGLAWIKSATPEQIMAALPADFYQGNPQLYRQSLLNNIESFSPDGRMPAEAPDVVYRAVTRFDPTLASAKIDVPATYDNAYVEQALRSK
jgi:NitT/TauT family transport system substrate-binding protein